MQARLDWSKSSPEVQRAMYALERSVRELGLEPSLVHLIKIRASQLNGCAYCVDSHVKEARKDGHSEQWVTMISAWQESPRFTPKERAVLEWTEALTLLAASRAPDAAFEGLKPHFSEKEIVNLTHAISTINAWNRIGVGFRMQHPVD